MGRQGGTRNIDVHYRGQMGKKLTWAPSSQDDEGIDARVYGLDSTKAARWTTWGIDLYPWLHW